MREMWKLYKLHDNNAIKIYDTSLPMKSTDWTLIVVEIIEFTLNTILWRWILWMSFVQNGGWFNHARCSEVSVPLETIIKFISSHKSTRRGIFQASRPKLVIKHRWDSWNLLHFLSIVSKQPPGHSSAGLIKKAL